MSTAAKVLLFLSNWHLKIAWLKPTLYNCTCVMIPNSRHIRLRHPFYDGHDFPLRLST